MKNICVCILFSKYKFADITSINFTCFSVTYSLEGDIGRKEISSVIVLISHRTYKTLISNALKLLYCQAVSYLRKVVDKKTLYSPSAIVSLNWQMVFCEYSAKKKEIS